MASTSGSKTLPVHIQILGGFMALQIAVTTASLWVLNRVHTSRLQAELARELDAARDTFNFVLEQRDAWIKTSLSRLADDHNLPVLASKDDQKAKNALLTIKDRMQRKKEAGQLVLIDAQGHLRATTGPLKGYPVQNLRVVQDALAGKTSVTIETTPNHAFQMGGMPLYDRRHAVAGALLLLKYVGSDFGQRYFKRLSRFQIAISAKQKLLTHTLDDDAFYALQKEMPKLAKSKIYSIGPKDKCYVVLPLPVAKDIQGYALEPWDAAYGELRKNQRLLLQIGSLGLACTALLGYFISKGITLSMNRLIEKLTELNEFKSKFFSTVSHDIKNPLASVQLGMEFLQHKISEPKDTATVQNILKSVKTLDFFVSDLVDFAAIESGKLSVHMKEMDLVQVIRDIQARFEPLAAQKGVSFVVSELPASLQLRGDPQRIAQVLQNLCANALNYTPSKGTITLSARVAAGQAKVCVQDTGIGIAPKDLPRVFNNFFQAENARRMREGGFGLGLKIAREIVSAHGGEIGADSVLGEGSTFHFILPMPA